MPPTGFDKKDDQVPSNLTSDAAITNKEEIENHFRVWYMIVLEIYLLRHIR
jgi:hypothetical protein